MKRHIFVCAGCDLLAESSRRDATTCSPACRVRAHREGTLNRLRQELRESIMPGVTCAEVLRAAAVDLLRPDLGASIMAGRLTMDEAQPDVCNAFDEALRAQMVQS